MDGSSLFLDVPGARLRYRSAGRGPTLLLAHGWTLDLDMWEPQFAGLADDYRLIAWDRRGYGHSTGVPEPERDVDDLLRLLAVLDVSGPISILGMSQGARTALAWAARYPDRTAGVVLDGAPQLSSTVPQEDAGELPLEELRDLAQREGLQAFRTRWLDDPLMRLYGTDRATRALVRDMVSCYDGRDLAPARAQVQTEPLPPRVLDLPVLIVNGEHDTEERRRAGRDLARRFARARRVVIPAAGHLANLDNPRAYNDALRRFLMHTCDHAGAETAAT